MARTILFVHGRSFKPSKAALSRIWQEALRHGIGRDRPEKLDAFDRATREFVYFGDVSNAFLRSLGQDYDEAADVESRRRTLAALKEWGPRQFTKRNYERLPGKAAYKEFLADLGASVLGPLRLTGGLIELAAPDIREYWNFDSEFGTEVRYPMIAPLKRAMKRGDRILVVAHSLGTMIAWDTFWKFSRAGEYRPTYSRGRIDLFLSLGSPLGDETVKRKLKGSRADGARRYPGNIRRWVNVAAEDDYISHDSEVANDFRPMIDHEQVEAISDQRIYNLALRDGRSNPHHGAGYLVHPVVVKHVADWL